MSDPILRYDALVENALRGVVRQVLRQVADAGVPGDHHFYITFRTDHPDCQVPDQLRDRYPNEMTIVLQHQFWDLIIEEDHFSVLLSFSNVPHKLVVPFAALTAFADPSVRFGLQFEEREAPGEAAEAEFDSEGEIADPDARLPASKATESGAPSAPEDSAPEGNDGDKVVTLDRFRKK